MVEERLLSDTRQVIEEGVELLDDLPPLSADHETVRLAVVRARRAEASLRSSRELTSRAIGQSRETIDEARRVVSKVRNGAVRRRTRRPMVPSTTPSGHDGNGDTADAMGMSIFLDLDTVLLAKHPGRYGPELGLQADLPEAIQRMSEIADRIIVVVNPRSPNEERRHGGDTPHRVEVLEAGLGESAERLIVATCSHGENGSCDCAKPGHGLIGEYLDRRGDGQQGWYIGGDQEGMVAGRSAGLRTIRIGPHGDDHLSTVHRPDYEARDLLDAANHILVEELAAT